ncbi:MAG: hypothetical protein Q4C81_04350 [Kocuria sp.]|nr:hypothetical protein [Kocuria sp.]
MKNHIRVCKDPYTYQSWTVSFAGFRIGSAHSGIVAQEAVQIAAHYALIINPSNVCPAYLVANVARDMETKGLARFWIPEPVTGGQQSIKARTA